MKFIILFLVSFLALPVYAGSIDIEVSLSPAGTFTIHSDSVEGKVIKKGDVYEAAKLEVPIDSLDTGINLRNKHMWKRLQGEDKTFTHITVTEARGTNGKGSAKISVLGKTHTLDFTFKDLGNKLAEASFKVEISKFGIKDVSYLGVGVDDEMLAKVKMNYDLQ